MKLNKRIILVKQFSNIFVRKNVGVSMNSYFYVSKGWFSKGKICMLCEQLLTTQPIVSEFNQIR